MVVGTVPTETDGRCRNALNNALPTIVPLSMSIIGSVMTETDSRCLNALDNAVPTVVPVWMSIVSTVLTETDSRLSEWTRKCTADSCVGVDVDCQYGTDRDRQ